MNEPLSYQLTGDLEIFIQEPGIDPRERTAVKGKQTSPIQRCAAAGEKRSDRAFHLARRERSGKLALVAENAPLGTPEV